MFNFEDIKGKLVVSCQALPDEPLHSAFIMGRMARAAKEGGAAAIRAQHGGYPGNPRGDWTAGYRAMRHTYLNCQDWISSWSGTFQ